MHTHQIVFGPVISLWALTHFSAGISNAQRGNLSAHLLLFWAELGLDYLTNCSTWIYLVSSLFLFLKVFVSLQEHNLSCTNVIYHKLEPASWTLTFSAKQLCMQIVGGCACSGEWAFHSCCVLVGTTLGQQPGKVWGHWLHLSSSFGAEQWPEGKCWCGGDRWILGYFNCCPIINIYVPLNVNSHTEGQKQSDNMSYLNPALTWAALPCPPALPEPAPKPGVRTGSWVGTGVWGRLVPPLAPKSSDPVPAQPWCCPCSAVTISPGHSQNLPTPLGRISSQLSLVSETQTSESLLLGALSENAETPKNTWLLMTPAGLSCCFRSFVFWVMKWTVWELKCIN